MGDTKQGPLKPEHHRAAAILGQGQTIEKTAAEVGVSEKTIKRWKQREDFMALVKQNRDAVLDATPSARATLESLLTATTKNGQPALKIRLDAAKVLMLGVSADPEGGGDGGAAPDFRERIYVSPEE